MSILNYTTKIDPWKTVGEIQQILSRHGVTNISIRNEDSMPAGLMFSIDYYNPNNQEARGIPLNFSLPCNWNGVLNCMKKDKKIPANHKTREQALRTSWRIIKDWVEAQMAIVEAELSPLQEVFLPYLVNSRGETLSSRVLTGSEMKLLQ